MLNDLILTLLAILTLVFTYKLAMRVLGKRQQNKQIFHQAFKLLPLENSLQTSWDHIEGYFSDRAFPCTLDYLESFSDGVTLVHRVRVELLHQNHIIPDTCVRLFSPYTSEEQSNPASPAFRRKRSSMPSRCKLMHEDWEITLPTDLLYPRLFSHPSREAFSLPEELSLFELTIDRDHLTLTVDIYTETAINQARQMAHLCTRLLEFLPTLTTTPELNTPYHLLHLLVLEDRVQRGDEHLIDILDVLLEHPQHHLLTQTTWLHLTRERSLENLYYLFTYCPSQLIQMLSDDELVEFFQRMTMSDLNLPDTHLITLLPRLSLSILCDPSLTLPWKLRLLSLWLEDDSETRQSTQTLQAAIHNMIVAHPFERQRIQQHISRSPGLATRQDGQLSLSHGLSHGSLSMLPEFEE